MNDTRSTTKGEARNRFDKQDPLGPNSEIGRKLKQYYNGLISEEIPDRFNELLRQLEDKKNSGSRESED